MEWPLPPLPLPQWIRHCLCLGQYCIVENLRGRKYSDTSLEYSCSRINLEPPAKVFSMKFGRAVPSYVRFQHSAKLSLHTDPWKFSPSKAFHYTVSWYCPAVQLLNYYRYLAQSAKLRCHTCMCYNCGDTNQLTHPYNCQVLYGIMHLCVTTYSLQDSPSCCMWFLPPVTYALYFMQHLRCINYD